MDKEMGVFHKFVLKYGRSKGEQTKWKMNKDRRGISI